MGRNQVDIVPSLSLTRLVCSMLQTRPMLHRECSLKLESHRNSKYSTWTRLKELIQKLELELMLNKLDYTAFISTWVQHINLRISPSFYNHERFFKKKSLIRLDYACKPVEFSIGEIELDSTRFSSNSSSNSTQN